MIFVRGHFDNNIVQESVVNESLKEVRTFSAKTAYTTKPTVFLSHKHDDLKDLKGVMGLLRDQGVKVYIDSMDNKMPAQTTGETAERIKDVIKYCDKFILLATEKAIESYWCNWELGIGDVHKYVRHIAIVPIKESGEADYKYKGNEYMQIYPSIDFEDGTGIYRNTQQPISRGYYVSNPVNKDGVRYITPLKDWLNRK